MLVRLVRLTLHPDAINEFLVLFDEAAPQIRAFSGCQHLTLWQDVRFPNILTTHSQWRDADALEHYRESPLFKATWAETKRLFAAPPEARSLRVQRADPGSEIAARE